MNILNRLRSNIVIKKFIAHITLLSYLLTIFSPLISKADNLALERYEQVTIAPLKPTLLRNPDFDAHLTEVLQNKKKVAPAEATKKTSFEPTWEGTKKAWRVKVEKKFKDRTAFEYISLKAGELSEIKGNGLKLVYRIINGVIHLQEALAGLLKSTGKLFIDEGAIVRGKNLTIEAPEAQVDGSVLADILRWNTLGTLRIGARGSIAARQELHVKVGKLIIDKPGYFTGSHSGIDGLKILLNAEEIRNYGAIGSDWTKTINILAPTILNKGTIEALHDESKTKILVLGIYVNNIDGQIHGTGSVSVKATELHNQRGRINGDQETIVMMDDSTDHASTVLDNKEGIISSTYKTVVRFIKQAVAPNLGKITGSTISLIDQSNSSEFKLEEGTLEADKHVFIKALMLHAPNIHILSPVLYATVSDLLLSSKAQSDRTIIRIRKGHNVHLTHPFSTAGTLEFWEENLTSEAETQVAIEHLYGLDGLIESPYAHTIHLDSEIQAKDLKIYAPQALLRFGEQKDGKATPTIDLQQGNLSAYVNTFDLENAVLAANNAFVHAPMGIRIGRLVRDTTRDLFVTFYAHGQKNTSMHLGPDIAENPSYTVMGKKFEGVYDGRHLVRLPIFISNKSVFTTLKGHTKFKGPLLQQGQFETNDFTLESFRDSIFEASNTHVQNNLMLNGPSKLFLRPIIGILRFYYQNYATTISRVIDRASSSWANLEFMSSDKANFKVGSTIISDSKSTFTNYASIFSAYEISSFLSMVEVSFSTSFFQKFIGGSIAERDLLFQGATEPRLPVHAVNPYYCNGCVPYAQHFLWKTNNFEGAQNFFPFQTTCGSGTILSPTTTALTGFVSAPLMLIPVGADGLAIGSRNPYYVPSKSPIADLMARPFNVMSITMHQDLQKVLATARPQFHFKMRERFWFDEAKAQAFSEDIKDHQVVLTKHGAYRKLDTSVFTLSPSLLVDRVQDACQETLMRGYIEHGKTIDTEYVKELHRNATEYLSSVELDSNSLALVLASKGGTKTLLPTKPLIYYEEVMNEQDVEELTAKVFFPPAMIEEVRTKNNSHIHTKVLGIFPEGMSPIQLLEYFKSIPTVCRQVAKLLLPDELTHLYLEDAPSAAVADVGGTSDTIVSMSPGFLAATGGSGDLPTSAPISGAIDIYTDITADHIAIVAQDALKIHGASLKANTVFLASLNDVVNVVTQKRRLYAPGRMWEEIDKRASIVAEGYINIFAGKDVVLQGVETHSGEDTYIQALGRIYDIPVELLWQTVNSYRHKKKTITEVNSGLTNVASTHTAGGTYATLSGDATVLQGIGLKAHTASLTAGGDLLVTDMHDIRRREVAVQQKGGWFSRSQSSHESSTSISSRSALMDIAGDLILLGQNVALSNPAIRAAKTVVNTIGGTGTVQLLMGRNEIYRSNSSTSSSALWTTSKAGSSHDVTYTEPQIQSPVEVHVRQLFIEGIASQSTALARRIMNMGGETRTIPLEEIHQMQAMSYSSPTRALATTVGLAVAIGTGGWGTKLAAEMMVANEIAIAAMSAAISSMAATAAVGTLQHRDITEGIGSVFTSEGLRNTAMAVATAGLNKKLMLAYKVPVAATTLGEHAQRAAIHATANTTSSIVISGTRPKDALRDAPGTIAAATAGGLMANKIGAWYHGHPDAYIIHKLAHALNGAGIAAIRGGGRDAMLSGAAGAVMAEMLMEGMVDKGRLMADGNGGVGKVTDERLVYNPVTGTNVPTGTVEGIQFERNLAHILGAATGMFVGGDVNASSLTASNAVDNNFLAAPLFYLLATEEGLALLAGAGITYFGSKKLAASCTSNMDGPLDEVRWRDEGFMADPDLGKPRINSTPIPSRALQELILTTPIYTKSREALIETYPELEPEMRRLGMLEGFSITNLPDMSIFTRDDAHYILYGKPKEGMPDYIGRTRVYGESITPEMIKTALERRDRNHHMNGEGFGRAREIDVSAEYNVIRGLEQMYIDENGGAKSMGGTSSNRINAISKTNPKRQTYLEAAKKGQNGE